MELNKHVHAYRGDMTNFLAELVRIPSVEEEAKPGMPFGQACYDALAHTLFRAKEMGFERSVDVDGYAGYVEIGRGKKELGILAHLDVVPAGQGWSVEPFGGQVIHNRVYGRGAMDDKGAVVATLYAMRALYDMGAEFQARVRLIIGCNEETGMKCLEHYKSVQDMPDYGFSPDAEYPLINMEKGILQVQVSKACGQTEGDGIRLLSAGAGERCNVVPGEAGMRLAGDGRQIVEVVNRYFQKSGHAVDVKQEGDVYVLKAQGKPAHASTPEKGVNAAGVLCGLLHELKLADGAMEQAVLTMARYAGSGYDGAAFGLNVSDQSGALTCNLGILNLADGRLSFSLDIRYPVTFQKEFVLDKLRDAFAGFDVQEEHAAPAHCVDNDHPLVATLLRVYNEQTGGDGQPIATGGGTYARVMPNRAVAFGMQFPGTPDVVHQADEYIEVDELVKNAQIIAHAIYALACTGVMDEMD